MNKRDFTQDFILLNVGHASHNADWNWKNVYSPFARIHYVASGTAQIARESGDITLTPGHLYLTPPHVTHSYRCDGRLELYYIHIYEDLGNSISYFDLIDFPVEVEAFPYDLQLINRLIELNHDRGLSHFDPRTYDNSSNLTQNICRQKDVALASELETQGILKTLFSRFVAPASYRNNHIEHRILKSLQHIYRNTDKPLSIDELAEMCCMTKDHYIRLFKKEMHSTPGKYINRRKIERIQLSILLDDKPIKDIAYAYGFDNIPYFNRLFKQITGESPKEFKQKSRTRLLI